MKNKNNNKFILGMGNAVLDILVPCNDQKINELGLEKGVMTIVDQIRSDEVLNSVDSVKKISGGSVANTIVGISKLGGNGAFCGRVKNDKLGKDFIDDIKNVDVKFLCEPSFEGPPTARCLVFVTEDGERTMQTFLGSSVNLCEQDIKEHFFDDVSFFFIEGYLWSSNTARSALKKATEIAISKNIKIVFSLSDPGLTKMYKDDFLEFIQAKVDILIGNNHEFQELTNENEDSSIKEKINTLVNLAVMTKGVDGAIAFSNGNKIGVESKKNIKILDSTGAGDLFAAGFLFSLNNGLEIEDCLKTGCDVASKILTQYGARL